jgi:hypothetical protein
MRTASAEANRADPRLNDFEVRTEAFRTVFATVTGTLPTARVHGQFKRLWPRRLGQPSEQDSSDLTTLLLDTLAFARDPKGRTAFDRLARKQAFAEGTIEAAALERVCAARFRILDVVEAGNGVPVQVYDPVADLDALLEPCTVVTGERIAGRFAPLADGTLTMVSCLVRVDARAWPAAADQIDRARGGALRNPERAAEAIYASVIAAAVESGTPLAEVFVEVFPDESAYGPNVSFSDGRWHVADGAPDFLYDVLNLAEAWAWLDSPEPERADPEGARWLRREVLPEDVYTLAALADHVPEDSAPGRALATMLRIALDTVEHRAAVGLGDGMAQFEAELGTPGAWLTQSAWERLQRVRARHGAGPGAHDPTLDRVIQRIHALQAKTQAAGCTEAEAMAAAEKAEQLLRRYDVQFTPEQIAATECTSARIATPRKRQDALDHCAGAVARFCGCRHWMQHDGEDRITHVLFGLPADVAAAETLFHVIAETFELETARFKAGETYAATPSNQRSRATKSFRYGLTQGISDKLSELETYRARQTRNTTGQDLVPVKAQTIDDALQRLGLVFKQNSRQRTVDPQAYQQGIASGRAFQPEPGVHAGSTDTS